MTTFTNELLLPTTLYGSPSGNYNGTTPDFIGNSVPAANFYNGQGAAQTVLIQTTSFVGVITLEASLNDWHEQAMWFEIGTYGNASVPTTNTEAINIVGNFAWIRANVTAFTGGTINSASVVY